MNANQGGPPSSPWYRSVWAWVFVALAMLTAVRSECSNREKAAKVAEINDRLADIQRRLERSGK